MKPRENNDAIRSIQEWIATASDKELAEVAVFLNETFIPAEKRRAIIKEAIGIIC